MFDIVMSDFSFLGVQGKVIRVSDLLKFLLLELFEGLRTPFGRIF
jgi:hypothetical protein